MISTFGTCRTASEAYFSLFKPVESYSTLLRQYDFHLATFIFIVVVICGIIFGFVPIHNVFFLFQNNEGTETTIGKINYLPLQESPLRFKKDDTAILAHTP